MNILDKYFEILRQFSNYEPRKAQELMVSRVAQSIALKQTLVVEAGTGSGKSFGYLIPALFQDRLDAEGKKKPVAISTATIALQEQLLQKDIPFLAKAAGLENLNVKLVKGRGNYLCIQKLTELERQVKSNSSEFLHINYLKSELQGGWNGDIADLEFSIPPELWKEIRSDSEDCLGRRCRFYDQNPYRQAREDLDQADVLIANHALYLQDLSAAQSLLPPHDVVIFDEAHQLKHYALGAFTVRIGKFATQKLLQKIHRRLQPLPEHFHHQIVESESAIFEWLFRSENSVFRLYPDDLFLYIVKKHIFVLQELEQWLVGMDVKQLTIIRPDLFESELDMDKAKVQREKLIKQLQGLIARWEYFLEEDPFSKQRVNWVEVDKDRLYYELKSTPLNISEIMGTQLWQEKTGILTSATLAVNNNLAFIRKDLGIEESEDMVLPSPFNYEDQCVLYLPSHLPDPNSDLFNIAITEEIADILHLSQGRAFVLFTSNQAMRRVSDALIPRLPFPCKVQGEMPRNRLIEWFKETPNSVIFATSTFWEGIDVPGESLSCVIMDKIPFSPPGDPVNQAVVDYIKARGDDWFGQYVLPQAVIKLKQGFGRLIRTGHDKGLVAILDPRVRQKGYGKIIQRSLPAVQTVQRLSDVPFWLFAPLEPVTEETAQLDSPTPLPKAI
ncbi:ATP-dependent DNA helicase [Vampirovibrio sp.]|uniref:ATP-dependent DNA helicase n=1 Tax=Vampirovibrio sp. TaxID=2717857 RepID=UPI0035931C54